MFQAAIVQKVYVTEHLTPPASPVLGTVHAGSPGPLETTSQKNSTFLHFGRWVQLYSTAQRLHKSNINVDLDIIQLFSMASPVCSANPSFNYMKNYSLHIPCEMCFSLPLIFRRLSCLPSTCLHSDEVL